MLLFGKKLHFLSLKYTWIEFMLRYFYIAQVFVGLTTFNRLQQRWYLKLFNYIHLSAINELRRLLQSGAQSTVYRFQKQSQTEIQIVEKDSFKDILDDAYYGKPKQ